MQPQQAQFSTLASSSTARDMTPPTAAHAAAHPDPLAISGIDRYDGYKDPTTWAQILNLTADIYGWSDDTRLKVARIRLGDEAQQWAQTRCFNNWEEFQAQLVRRFGVTQEAAIRRLECCYQALNESPRAFADRFMQDAARSGRKEDAALLHQFMLRLQPCIKTEVLRKQPHSIDEVVDYCNYWLSAQGGLPYHATTAYNGNNNCSSARGHPSSQHTELPPRTQYEHDVFEPSFNLMDHSWAHVPPPPPRPSPLSCVVDDLTRRLAALETTLEQHAHHMQHMQQQIEGKDRDIRTLQYALQALHDDQDGRPHIINLMDASDLYSPPTATKKPTMDSAKQHSDITQSHHQAKHTACHQSNPLFPVKPYRPKRNTPTAFPPTDTTATPHRLTPTTDLPVEEAKKMATDICRSIKPHGGHHNRWPPQARKVDTVQRTARLPSYGVPPMKKPLSVGPTKEMWIHHRPTAANATARTATPGKTVSQIVRHECSAADTGWRCKPPTNMRSKCESETWRRTTLTKALHRHLHPDDAEVPAATRKPLKTPTALSRKPTCWSAA